MNHLFRVLIFLRLIDEHDHQVSLTNVALIVTLVKLALAPQASITDVAAVFLSLAAYTGKKIINKQPEVKSEVPQADPKMTEIQADVQNLKDKFSSLSMTVGLKTKI